MKKLIIAAMVVVALISGFVFASAMAFGGLSLYDKGSDDVGQGDVNTTADGKILQITKSLCHIKHKKISASEDIVISECTKSVSFRKSGDECYIGKATLLEGAK